MLPNCPCLFQIDRNFPSDTSLAVLELLKGVSILGAVLNDFKARLKFQREVVKHKINRESSLCAWATLLPNKNKLHNVSDLFKAICNPHV
jgi:hypothetical protein